MKKRIISSVLATLLGVFGCFGMASCETTQEDDVLVGKVCLNDFETYKPDFQLIRVLNGFGAIDVNKDMKFVKSGTKNIILRINAMLLSNWISSAGKW